MNFQDGNRPTSSESKCNIEEFNGELRRNDEDIHEQQEIIIVKEEWIEDSCSSWTEESILPESSAGDSSQQMEINNELSGPSYVKEGGINYSGEDSLETDVSSQNLVCTHCNFKTFDSLDFETHIRQHVQVLFNNKMQEGVADRLNQSGETSSGQQFEESNDNSNLIEAEYTESFRTDVEAVLKKKKRIRPKPPKKEILFTCGYCDFKCPKTDTMKDHLKVVHAGKSAAAEKSLETSKPKLLLLKPEKEPLVCELCGFKCMKQSGMLVHNRSHTGERPFSCSYCEQKFMQKSHMVKHLKCHKGKITLNCKECAFVCSDPLVLSQHTQQEHKRVKTLQCCHLCEYKFLTASQLQRHLRTHSGERPFQCTVCDYRASQMDTLKAHFRTHSGEKPYSCALCTFRCTQLSALKTHQSTHTNEKPFACEMCAYRCARLSNLRRHMQRHAPKS